MFTNISSANVSPRLKNILSSNVQEWHGVFEWIHICGTNMLACLSAWSRDLLIANPSILNTPVSVRTLLFLCDYLPVWASIQWTCVETSERQQNMDFPKSDGRGQQIKMLYQEWNKYISSWCTNILISPFLASLSMRSETQPCCSQGHRFWSNGRKIPWQSAKKSGGRCITGLLCKPGKKCVGGQLDS